MDGGNGGNGSRCVEQLHFPKRGHGQKHVGIKFGNMFLVDNCEKL